MKSFKMIIVAGMVLTVVGFGLPKIVVVDAATTTQVDVAMAEQNEELVLKMLSGGSDSTVAGVTSTYDSAANASSIGDTNISSQDLAKKKSRSGVRGGGTATGSSTTSSLLLPSNGVDVHSTVVADSKSKDGGKSAKEGGKSDKTNKSSGKSKKAGKDVPPPPHDDGTCNIDVSLPTDTDIESIFSTCVCVCVS